MTVIEQQDYIKASSEGDNQGMSLLEVLSETLRLHNRTDVTLTYPCIINGKQHVMPTFEKLLHSAIYDCETFEPIVEGHQHYSENQLDIIFAIIDYQLKMGAISSIYFTAEYTAAEIKALTHKEVRRIIRGFSSKNKGFYYMPTLDGYISTHLYENPSLIKGNKGGRRKKEWLFGRMCDVFSPTMQLYCGSSLDFCYPYAIKEQEGSVKRIDDLIKVVLTMDNPQDLILQQHMTYYSNQEKKLIRNLVKYQTAVLQGEVVL